MERKERKEGKERKGRRARGDERRADDIRDTATGGGALAAASAAPASARKSRGGAAPAKSDGRLFAEKVRRSLRSGRGGAKVWTVAFLEVLARTANVSLACLAADTPRQNAYQLRDRDATFRALWDEALETAADLLVEEAWRRAVEGVEKYVVSLGKVARDDDGRPMMQREYSDHLLDRLLRAHRPEQFRDNVSVTGSSETTVKVYRGFDPDRV